MSIRSEDWLRQRGLMDAPKPNTINDQGGLFPGDSWGDQATLEPDAYLDAIAPSDYGARVEALRAALHWSGIHPTSPERTLQRALDFHAFLMGRTQKEPVHTDE